MFHRLLGAGLFAIVSLSVGVPALSAPSATSNTAVELQAQLVKRSGGEWVIVRLGRSSALSPTALSLVGDEAGVHKALREYERALEQRDLQRLSRVWVMNPAERAAISRFFDESPGLDVEIEPGELTIRGDQATLLFHQRFRGATLPIPAKRARPGARRSLGSHDGVGTWELSS